MILHTGNLTPTKEQLAHARKWGDNSFCTTADEDFMQNFPVFAGWFSSERECILLKLKNVEPHTDPWVSRGAEPRARRAIFWLLAGGYAHNDRIIHFGCGSDIIKMKAGDFVVFNDKKPHWVMSDRQWIGAAVQLQPVKA